MNKFPDITLKKPPCLYPLDDRRCCECEACHSYTSEMAQRILEDKEVRARYRELGFDLPEFENKSVPWKEYDEHYMRED